MKVSTKHFIFSNFSSILSFMYYTVLGATEEMYYYKQNLSSNIVKQLYSGYKVK